MPLEPSSHLLDDTLHKLILIPHMVEDSVTTTTITQATDLNLATRYRSRNLQHNSDSNDGGFFPVFLFFVLTWVTIILIKKCCCTREELPVAVSAPSAPPTQQHAGASEGNVLATLTPEERRVYVSDLLRSEKYEAPVAEMDETSVESVYDEDQKAPANEGDIELGDMSVTESSRTHCAICLDRYNDGDEVCLSNNSACAHRFHRDCMVDWLKKHEECPCCRRPYLHENFDQPPP